MGAEFDEDVGEMPNGGRCGCAMSTTAWAEDAVGAETPAEEEVVGSVRGRASGIMCGYHVCQYNWVCFDAKVLQ